MWWTYHVYAFTFKNRTIPTSQSEYVSGIHRHSEHGVSAGCFPWTNFKEMSRVRFWETEIFFIQRIKQTKAILSALKGRDVFVNLPTGYGKVVYLRRSPCVFWLPQEWSSNRYPISDCSHAWSNGGRIRSSLVAAGEHTGGLSPRYPRRGYNRMEGSCCCFIMAPYIDTV